MTKRNPIARVSSKMRTKVKPAKKRCRLRMLWSLWTTTCQMAPTGIYTYAAMQHRITFIMEEIAPYYLYNTIALYEVQAW